MDGLGELEGGLGWASQNGNGGSKEERTRLLEYGRIIPGCDDPKCRGIPKRVSQGCEEIQQHPPQIQCR